MAEIAFFGLLTLPFVVKLKILEFIYRRMRFHTCLKRFIVQILPAIATPAERVWGFILFVKLWNCIKQNTASEIQAEAYYFGSKYPLKEVMITPSKIHIPCKLYPSPSVIL